MLQKLLGLLGNRIVWAVMAVVVLGGGGYVGSQYLGLDLASSLGLGSATAQSDSSQPTEGETEGTQPDTLSVATGTPRPLLIGSFNIQRFGKSKSEKPEVMAKLQEVAYLYDVLAIQEVVSQDIPVIENFITALNQERQTHFNYITSPWLGETSYKEQYAFIYDTARVELMEQPFVIGDPDEKMQREPLVARFRVRSDDDSGFSFVLVNVHTKPDDAVDEINHISEILTYLENSYQGQEDDLLVLGDFNLSPDKIRADTQFAQRSDWDAVLGAHVMTNTNRDQAYDNILYRPAATEEYQGRSGVIDLTTKFQISSEQAREVSDHFPIWAVFSLLETPSATSTVAAQPTSNAAR